MVTINCAYTEAINPSAATPKLSREQVWKGLQRKIRKAQDFVPVIEATDVVEEKGDEVTRVAHFKSMHGQPPREVKEICRSFWPCRVDFHQASSGAVISNIVSNGESLEADDLNMTYVFEWRYPDVEEGSEKAASLMKEHTEGAKMAVHSSIEAMRRMGQAGELD